MDDRITYWRPDFDFFVEAFGGIIGNDFGGDFTAWAKEGGVLVVVESAWRLSCLVFESVVVVEAAPSTPSRGIVSSVGDGSGSNTSAE